MQPRLAALLFALGLADLAYVNLGLGDEVFGGGAAGEAASAPPGGSAPRNGSAREESPPAKLGEPAAPEVAVDGTPSPAPIEPAAPIESPPGAPAARDPLGSPLGLPSATPSAPAPAPAAPVASASALPDSEVTVGFPNKGTAWLTPAARAQLLELAAKLRAHPEYRVRVVGHADARGSREYNHDLGSRRARAVRDLLTKEGVSREQIELTSRGEEEPRALGMSEQVWAANRRVEITIGSERTERP